MARRHFVTLLALFGFANIYAMRANLSVAIVEMTTGTSYQLANGTTIHVRPLSHLLIVKWRNNNQEITSTYSKE